MPKNCPSVIATGVSPAARSALKLIPVAFVVKAFPDPSLSSIVIEVAFKTAMPSRVGLALSKSPEVRPMIFALALPICWA